MSPMLATCLLSCLELKQKVGIFSVRVMPQSCLQSLTGEQAEIQTVYMGPACVNITALQNPMVSANPQANAYQKQSKGWSSSDAMWYSGPRLLTAMQSHLGSA